MSFSTPLIKAPLTGIIIPLNQIDDEVFSKKMAGDGIAIDPASQTLFSPFDGVVSFIHPSKHAITLKPDENPEIEILIHIGIDTVLMKGDGFKSFVKNGQKIKAGEKLIEFDLNQIIAKAKSPHTIILITNTVSQPEKYSISFTPSSNGFVQALKTDLFSISTNQTAVAKNTSASSTELYQQTIKCLVPSGLHARPASMITKIAMKNTDGEVQIIRNHQIANAKSLTSIISLGVSFGDEIQILAYGKKSQDTVLEIESTLKNSNHEKATSTESTVAAPTPSQKSNGPEFSGISVSPGDSFGQTLVFRKNDIRIDASTSQKSNPDQELSKLKSAVSKAQSSLQETISNLSSKDSEKSSIYQAHLELLNDPEIFKLAQDQIKLNYSAEYSWQVAIDQTISILKSLKNEMMAERAHDVNDIGQKVLRVLLNVDDKKTVQKISTQNPTILIARSLVPSDMSLLDPQVIKGLVLIEGGASSHVAIIARSMGIPSITAVNESVLSIKDGTSAVLLAKKGVLNTAPTQQEIERIKISNVASEKENSIALAQAKAAAVTVDGHHIDVFANIGKISESEKAIQNGAEGVGLLRSEFLFLDRSTAPTEAEQTEQYQNVISSFNQDGKKDVIIRTLDVGGDKPLSYLKLPAEENPFLGVRGLRLSLKYPELFRSQIRSLLKVKPLASLKIMFPMITTLEEVHEARKITQEEASKLGVAIPQLGIMIEVPSAALIADNLAPHVDFFSIGSNDLTQYTLAIDRGHKDLAAMADGLHPSVLQLIKMTCDAAKKHGKMVGVCGGIASDIQAIPLLIGLGVHELSVSVPSIPQVKSVIRKLHFKECEQLALECLKLADAKSVRNLAEKVLSERGSNV
jgi:phosphoenolpyruvate-protein phosphotransferase